jgi:Tfp pilus assembly protein PilO
MMILETVVFRPLSNRLATLNQEVRAKEVELMKGLRIDEQRDRILKEYKSYEGYLRIKGSDEEIISEFLREIERLGRESTVSLLDIKPQSTNKRGVYKEYIIEVRLEAPMKSIIDFLYRLNNSVLLLKVEKLVLSLKEESSDILKVNMSISGAVLL